MAKRIRVYELARELGVDSKDVLRRLNEMGVTGKNHMTALDGPVVEEIKARFSRKPSAPTEPPKAAKGPAGGSIQAQVKQKTGAVMQPEKGTGPAPAPVPEQRSQTAKEPVALKDKTVKQPASAERSGSVSAASGERDSKAHSERAEVSRNTRDVKDVRKEVGPAGQPQRAGESRRAGQPQRAGSSQGAGQVQRMGQSHGAAQAGRRPAEKTTLGARRVVIQGDVPLRDLASLIGVPVPHVIRTLMSLGALISINQNVPKGIAIKVAQKLGCVVTVKEPEKSLEEIIMQELECPEDPAKSVPRPPVVTVMGHVDHGKTSLLDAIRHTNVTAKEAGGITQHIGASVVEHQGSKIIFLDTPGHEAFTQMRARGAKVTDVAVLVVAADDGVMPQTVEAMNHAKAAGVPVVVAINKVDKPGAKPERVKQQLAEIGLLPEEWGGDAVVVEVSAKTGQGLKDLLEMILLVAEMQELKADPSRKARGYIIESQMDKGRGPVATALVRSGALKVGDVVLTDTTWGRIRAMYDGRGRQVKKAGPSTPVELVGLESLPQAGDSFLVVDDERTAKEVTERRRLQRRTQEMESTHKFTLEDLLKNQEEKKRELKVIVKSDVQGSLEAILQALGKIKSPEVDLTVIHSGVGAIIESDVMLAKASDAKILGFNVRPDANARNVAESERVDIRTYRIIYDLLDDVESMLKGLVKPKVEEVLIGKAEVRATFHVPNVGTVAGCYVSYGNITRQAKVRLVRDGVVVYEGKISSLKRFKDDVSEVAQGYECGIGLDRYQDIKPGDSIEAFMVREVMPA